MSSPTSAPALVESPSTLVLGVLGVGTFIVFFLVFLNVVTWVMHSKYPLP